MKPAPNTSPDETRLQVLPRQQARSDSCALQVFVSYPPMHSMRIKPGVARCSAARGQTFARSRCLLVRAAGESRPLALPSGPIFTSLRTRLEQTPGDNLLGRLYKVVLPGAAGYLPALLSPTATTLSTTGAVFAPPFLLDLAAKYLVHSDVRGTISRVAERHRDPHQCTGHVSPGLCSSQAEDCRLPRYACSAMSAPTL